jgi:hypothetical protein
VHVRSRVDLHVASVRKTATKAWTSSVAFKLELAFAIIVALTGSAILLSILRLDELARVVNRVTGQNLPAVTASLSAAADTADVNAAAAELAAVTNERGRQARAARMQLTIAELRNQVGQLSTISDNAMRERLTRHLDALEAEARRLNSRRGSTSSTLCCAASSRRRARRRIRLPITSTCSRRCATRLNGKR